MLAIFSGHDSAISTLLPRSTIRLTIQQPLLFSLLSSCAPTHSLSCPSSLGRRACFVCLLDAHKHFKRLCLYFKGVEHTTLSCSKDLLTLTQGISLHMPHLSASVFILGQASPLLRGPDNIVLSEPSIPSPLMRCVLLWRTFLEDLARKPSLISACPSQSRVWLRFFFDLSLCGS